MKILIAIHYFPPHIGGMENVALKQAESLTRLGNDVTIFTCRHNRNLPLRETTPTGYEVKRFRSINFIETRLGMAFPIVSPINFFSIFKQIQSYDAIHVHDVFYMSSHLLGLAAIINKKPLFITQHVAIVDHPNVVVKHIQSLIYKTIGKFILNRARHIVVYNINVKNFLIKLGVNNSKILLNYNGIDTDYFSPPSSEEKVNLKYKYNLPIDKPVVIFVGRLIHEKGFDLVFDSRSSKRTTLIVGGGNVPRRMCKKDNVIFYGAASQSELADLYKLSDVFVFPAAVEMFPLVMQEAMACGLPVITADNPNYKHYNLRQNLLAFVSREKEVIKDEIRMLIQNKELRKKMSLYSRKLAVEKFSWNTNYKQEYGIYESILSLAEEDSL